MAWVKFNGKMYILIAKYSTKAAAQKRAAYYRKTGKYLARVVKQTHMNAHLRVQGAMQTWQPYWVFVYKKPTGKRRKR